MSKFFGIFQIVIGCSIFSSSISMYFTNYDAQYDNWKKNVIESICRIEEERQQNDRDMQGVVKIQKKIAGAAVRSTTLAARGIDAIVLLKDYTIMNTKPFTCIGNAFSDIQKDVHANVKEAEKLEKDLDSIQKRVDRQTQTVNDLQQLLAKNKEADQQQKTGRLLLLAALALAGIGFVISGGAAICHFAKNNGHTDNNQISH